MDHDDIDDPYGNIITTYDFPRFDGDCWNPDAFLDWVDEMDYIFEDRNVEDDAMRVEMAVASFKPVALSWWRSVQNFRVQEGWEEITTWSEMRHEMHCQFVPDTYRIDAYIRILEWKQQWGMSIREYTQVFEKLCQRAGIKGRDEQTVYLYISGLFDDKLKDELLNHDVRRTSEAIHIALMTENGTLDDSIDYWELRKENNNEAVYLLGLD